MYVRIRTTTDTIVVVESILSKIEDLRKSIFKKLKVDPKLQRLFHGGKLLENGYTLHDYNIKLNDVIQLMIMQKPATENETDEQNKTTEKSEEKDNNKTDKKIIYKDGECKMFSVGDIIDMCDEDNGAWYEGKIIRIVHKPDSEESTSSNVEDLAPEIHKESVMLYKIQFDTDSEEKCEEDELFCELKYIRPRARKEIALENLEVGQTVMLNYNIEEPTEKGNWYDFKVDGIEKERKSYKLKGVLYVGKGGTFQIEDVKVHDKIFAIEELVPVEERTEEQKTLMTSRPEKRSTALRCLTCRDNEDISCKDCGCYICRGKENPDKIMLCDECDQGYHMDCLTPPLTSLPEGDWYCPDCKRDTKAVVAPGASKQKKKASTSKTTRDWGRGMACVGKTKVCLLPLNHFGEIPGIEVGMCWRYRIQLSESGVHRPPVSGIHGRDVEGAYSIVLSGGYEDDVDNGEEFTYTGSGGRDLSGNKRTAEQSCDQTLTRENRALARNCAVKDISEEGADAGDKWREGKPVRVVRSFKMLRHFPKYAPKEGIRYDGLYKVVKYYPEKGLSGFRVWKYLLRRDDPSPAPWEKGAKQFSVVYPEGYLEAEQEMKHLDPKNRKRSADVENKEPRKKKRSIDSNAVTSPTSANKSAKKKNIANPKVPAGQKITNMFTPEMVPAAESMWNESEAFKNKGKTQTEGLEADQEMKSNPKNRKRCLDEDDNEPRKKRRSIDDKAVTSPPPANKSAKKKSTSNAKVPVVQKITNDEMDVIRADQLDSDLWNECLETFKSKGRTAFMDRLGEVFRCVICQEVCCNPVTTPCSHVYCMRCLKLSFKSSKSCPCCRGNLSEYEPEPNEKLKAALRLLLPGYDVARR